MGLIAIPLSSADFWPKLVGPDYVAVLMSECEAPRVVDEVAGDLDVLTRLTDILDGTVMILSVALEGDMCVFQSVLDDVAAWLTTR
jgi:hypothetical protein